MEIGGTLARRSWFSCIPLLALAGLACGSASSTDGHGGSNGAAGVPGAGGNGAAGAAGPAGSNGAAGATGVAGSNGVAGSTGVAGSSGPAGSSGAPGPAGSNGAAGNGVAGSGVAGAPSAHGGSTGTAGATGAAGAPSAHGGSTGTAGATGAAGSGAGTVPSAGCSATAAAPSSGKFTLDVSGTQREYIIKIPAGYDPTHPYRLIFALHGRMYDAQSVADGGAPSQDGPFYGVEARAAGSAIFVAGQALDTSWTDQNGRDIAYFDAMRTKFESQLCIDKSREFVMGFSMGAIMTIQIGCKQSNIYRAIAPMSGSLNGNTCSGTDPIAYWGSHGTNDPTIAIADGRKVRDNFRMRNHCTTTTTAGAQAGCVSYTGCDDGNPVSWCEFDGVHQPPPFSGQEIWNFFKQF